MDIITPAQRSILMSRIRGKDTGPELTVRRLLYRLGYRYRLHARDLPGRPDIVFKSRRNIIFVHGCFWHRHDCGLAYSPKTRRKFWERKFNSNVTRDRFVQRTLRSAGWRVLIIWECQINRQSILTKRLVKFLGPPPGS